MLSRRIPSATPGHCFSMESKSVCTLCSKLLVSDSFSIFISSIIRRETAGGHYRGSRSYRPLGKQLDHTLAHAVLRVCKKGEVAISCISLPNLKRADDTARVDTCR